MISERLIERARKLSRRRAQRNYVEAYPIVVASCFRRAQAEGNSLCVWIDNWGRTAGAASFSWDQCEGLQLRYGFEPDEDGEIVSGSVMLRPAEETSSGATARALLKCPRCGASRTGLVLKDENWLCQQCHGLIYRSTMVGTQVRHAERYARLVNELEELTRQGRRSDLIRRRGHEAQRALERAGPRPHPVANSNYAYQLSPHWKAGTFTIVRLDGERE